MAVAGRWDVLRGADVPPYGVVELPLAAPVHCRLLRFTLSAPQVPPSTATTASVFDHAWQSAALHLGRIRVAGTWVDEPELPAALPVNAVPPLAIKRSTASCHLPPCVGAT